MQRLDIVERVVQEKSEAIDGLTAQVRQSFQSSLELLEGLIEVLKDTTPDVEKQLQTKIETKRLTRALAKAEQEKKQIEQMVSNNVLRLTDRVVANSLMVARIFAADGTVDGAGRTTLEFNRLNKTTQEALLGKEVGFLHETESKEKLEVLEIYELVPSTPTEPQPEKV